MVETNDPHKPRFTLMLQATVTPFISVKPNRPIVFKGLAQSISDRNVDFQATSTPFKITGDETNLGASIGYELQTLEDGKHYRLRVFNKVKKGRYHGFIRLKTDHPHNPQITLRVKGIVEGEISVMPQSILVGKPQAGQPVRQAKAVVRSNINHAFKITRLDYDQKLLEIHSMPLPHMSGYTLEIVPRMENVPPGMRSTVPLTIETDAEPGEQHLVLIKVIHYGPPAKTIK